MSMEITRDQSVMLMLGSMHAEERLAVPLLNLADSYRRRGSALKLLDPATLKRTVGQRDLHIQLPPNTDR